MSEEYGRHVTADVRSPRRALTDFHQYPQVVNLIDRLLARGYSDEDVEQDPGREFPARLRAGLEVAVMSDSPGAWIRMIPEAEAEGELADLYGRRWIAAIRSSTTS